MKKLNHIDLQKKYPLAYDVLKDYYEDHNDGNRELWMTPDGDIEVIIGESVINEYDDRDMMYMLDWFGIHCGIVPEKKSHGSYEFSGHILRPNDKSTTILDNNKSRKQMENILIEYGMSILDDLLKSETIKYIRPKNHANTKE